MQGRSGTSSIFLTIHVEAGSEISDRDREVFDMYKPHFKQVQHLQDVQLHFEIPSEYAAPKPMFGDPAPIDEEEAYEDDISGEWEEEDVAHTPPGELGSD